MRTDLDRGAIAALDLLIRGHQTSEGEEEPIETAENIRDGILRDGLAIVIRRQIEFEKQLGSDEEFSVTKTYGRFPTRLRNLAARSG